MKKLVMILLLLSFVSASVDVNSSYVRDEYAVFDDIEGHVNLTITDESYDENIILSDGSSVGLGDFLDDNGADFECFPQDCSMSYEAVGGAKEKSIAISSGEKGYVGFVLQGDDIELNSMDFRISTDFVEGAQMPLSVRFFESRSWEFDKFSSNFLPKDWGCYDDNNRKLGPEIGNILYCEMIPIGNSDKLRVGAYVNGTGGNLSMTVSPESGFGGDWPCEFDPAVKTYCEIDASDNVLSEGRYRVCISSDTPTNYNIYEDESGETCGFTERINPEDSVKDYAIFAQGVKYAAAAYMTAEYMDTYVFDENDVAAANTIISERYHGDCSQGCVLPLEISGVNQNFKVYAVDLSYTDALGELHSNNLVYKLNKDPAKVNFPPKNGSESVVGTLDLELFGLTVDKAGEYFAELSGVDLFRKKISLLPAPIISSVLPQTVPAGVPIVFYVNVDFESNKSLSYDWDFGDNKSEKTDMPYVVHSYPSLQDYTLSVEVSAGGNLTSEKSFDIEVISPEQAVSERLNEMNTYLSNVKASIASFPSWYGNEVSKILEIDRIESELKRLEKAANESFDAEDFIDVAVALYEMDIPISVSVNNFDSDFLLSDIEDINIEPVATISGSVSGGTNEAYADPIMTWQNNNVDVVMNNKILSASYLNGDSGEFMNVYGFEITPRVSEESYFVVNKPFGELYFKDGSGARKAGEDAAVIILEPGKTSRFEFYYKDANRGSFFVSPRLASIVIEEQIEEDCNFNEVCEEALGENPDNCRNDCKPIDTAILLLVLVVFLFLVIYTVLQIWYKRHYEAYLFKDRAQLYNLLMYVSNARARNLNDGQIVDSLKKQGWSSERVNYVMKKSKGKSVGLIEIIPIEKISAMMRNKKAKKDVEMGRGSATGVQQQNNNNINKSGVQF